jgi:L-serine/L-threonine ammonia-lyase
LTARLALDTPLWESAPLRARLGAPVWLKMESHQPSGSFKLRGMERVCADFAARGIRRLVASSGGNAGIAAAYAARRLGLELVVVVPRSTPERARRRIAAEGARVSVEGQVWADADRCARALAEDPGTGYVHPYDHPLLWAGYADLIEEVAARSLRPRCVVLSVGGGGLLAGVLEGLDRVGWSALPVFAAETEGADSFAAARRAGAPVTLSDVRSVATSLGASRVCDAAWQRAAEHDVRTRVVSDAAAVSAVFSFAEDHDTLVEPACGAALAPIYASDAEIRAHAPALVVVCGGVCVDRALLSSWRARVSGGEAAMRLAEDA